MVSFYIERDDLRRKLVGDHDIGPEIGLQIMKSFVAVTDSSSGNYGKRKSSAF